MAHSGSAAKYFVYEIGCGGKKVLFRRVTHERESTAFFINGARPARLRTGSAYVHRRWIRGGASCEGSVRCWCVSGPVFSFRDYSLHIISIFKLLVRHLTESRVRRIQRCDWKIFRVIGRCWTNKNMHFGRRFVARVGWALCAGPARVASPVGGASWLGEPGQWGACACLVMGRGFWQGTPEEAHPAGVTLPENQVLRRFGPPAPYLPPLSSSQWCLVRASARRWGLVGTSLSAYWPLFAGLCRVLFALWHLQKERLIEEKESDEWY